MQPAPLLTELIRAAGEANGTGPLEVARGCLARAGFDITDFRSGEALVARRGNPKLLLSGHVDVVPAGEGWTHPPFAGEEADGRVWGRGAADMLGSVACYLALAEKAPDLPLGVVLTTDEETGMEQAEALVKERMLEGFEACVIGEPTDFEVGIAEKGVLWVRAVAEGRAAHASMPREGENAILKLAPALAALATPPFSDTHALLGESTASVDVVRGGVQVNVVPERAEVEVDYRYLPPHGPDDLLRVLRERLQEAAPDVRLEVTSSHPPFETRADAAIVQRARAAVESVTGRGEVVGLPYGTEASRFHDTPMDLVILGPGERTLAHTNRESIALHDLERGLAVYETIARAYAG